MALAVLFQADLAGLRPARTVEAVGPTLLLLGETWEMSARELQKLAPEIEEFALRLVEAYLARAEEIDAEIERLALENERIRGHVEGRQVRKVIVVGTRLVNIVTD